MWALTLTLQGPGARAIVRYAPAPFVILPLVVAAAFLFYGACLHGPLSLSVRRLGSPAAVVVMLCAAATINLAIYPRVDALKRAGRGSDEDDALVDVAERLVTGRRPVYVPTYLGNAPSVGPVWAVLVSPLAVTGTYALLTPLAAAVLVWMVRRTRDDGGAAALTLLLPFSSMGFWELSVTGSDLFAIGVLFAVVVRMAWGRSTGIFPLAGLAVLVSAVASSRVPFAWVTANLSALMWRRWRAGAVLVGGVTAATAALQVWGWRHDPEGTPLHLISKLAGLLGGSGVALAVIAGLASAAGAAAYADDTIDTWWTALWMLLVIPLAVVSVGALVALGWRLADWQAAGYVEVAVPALVASVAIHAARQPAEAR